MQWFQHQPGLVDESARVTHCTAEAVLDGSLESLCHRKFLRNQVEVTAEPGTAPSEEQSPLAPCVPCLLRAISATQPGGLLPIEPPVDQPAELELPAEPSSATRDTVTSKRGDPGHRQEKTVLAVSLRKAQWLLDDAAHEIPTGRYSSSDATELATTLEELAQLLRRLIGHLPHCSEDTQTP